MALDFMSTGSVNYGNAGRAFARGAIAGGISAVAAPVAGSMVLSSSGTRIVGGLGMRATASGYASRGLAVGISSGGGALGQLNHNLLNSNASSYSSGLSLAALGGGVGQGTANLVRTTGFNTIRQVNRFRAAPRNVSGFYQTPNGRAIATGFGVSSSISTFTSGGMGSLPSMTNHHGSASGGGWK